MVPPASARRGPSATTESHPPFPCRLAEYKGSESRVIWIVHCGTTEVCSVAESFKNKGFCATTVYWMNPFDAASRAPTPVVVARPTQMAVKHPWSHGHSGEVPTRGWELRHSKDGGENWFEISPYLSFPEVMGTDRSAKGKQLSRGRKPKLLAPLLIKGASLHKGCTILYVGGRLGIAPLAGVMCGHSGICVQTEEDFGPASDYLGTHWTPESRTWLEPGPLADVYSSVS